MINIVLVCNHGLSTSLLVENMQRAAEKKGVEANIIAESVGARKEIYNADVILLGPQIRYLVAKMKERVGENVPVAVVETRAYGMMDGDQVIEDALKLINDK